MSVWMSHAQQEPQYTQYMLNPLSLNPAYAGSREAASLIGLYRAQWVGLDGGPRTGQLSVHAPVGKKSYGLGLSVMVDGVGPARDTYASGAFAYPMELSGEVVLRLGLSAGAHFFEVDYSRLNPENPEDPGFQGRLTRTSPIIGTGAYLYGEDWFVGLSAPSILQTEYYDDIQQSVASKRMHLYFSGGYTFRLSDLLSLKPATMVRVVSGAPLLFDLSANFLFDERFLIGAAYRIGSAVSGLAGFQVSEWLFIGYAYDRDISYLGNFNSGSHEILLRYDFLSAFCNCFL